MMMQVLQNSSRITSTSYCHIIGTQFCFSCSSVKNEFKSVRRYRKGNTSKSKTIDTLEIHEISFSLKENVLNNYILVKLKIYMGENVCIKNIKKGKDEQMNKVCYIYTEFSVVSISLSDINLKIIETSDLFDSPDKSDLT